MSEGGGLLNDLNLTWKDPKFVLWDYNGTVPTKNPALRVILVDEDGVETEQYWSAGDAKNWVPSSDAKRLVATGTAETVVRSTNMGILIDSLVNSGYPEDQISDDVSVFAGMVAHMIQVPAPKRAGLAATPTARSDGRVFEKTILVVDNVVTMPGEKKGTTKRKAAGPTPAKTDASDDGALNAKTAAMLKKLLEDNLGEHSDGLMKVEIPKLAFAEMRGDADRDSMVKLVFEDEFLSDGGGDPAIWKYADGKVSLA